MKPELNVASCLYTVEASESAVRAAAELDVPDPEDADLPRLLGETDEAETADRVRVQAE